MATDIVKQLAQERQNLEDLEARYSFTAELQASAEVMVQDVCQYICMSVMSVCLSVCLSVFCLSVCLSWKDVVDIKEDYYPEEEERSRGARGTA